MKLKFELKRANIENLHKLLQLTSTIWKNDDKIYFYFDADQMIVYPENRTGFDKVFARIHINNTNPKGNEVSLAQFLIVITFRDKTFSRASRSNHRKRRMQFWYRSIIFPVFWRTSRFSSSSGTMPCLSSHSATKGIRSKNSSRLLAARALPRRKRPSVHSCK